jgi:uncharacterized protein YndB with AHSA1/START domain/DNA-binding transcriptional ArsR family regulator
MTATDRVWRALADPTRRRILDLLRDEPRTTGTLVAAFPDVTRFAVMKHLTALERANLVVVRRKGRERWNHINVVPLRRAYERFLRPYADAGAQALLRLSDAVAEKADPMSTTAPTVAITTMDNQLEHTIHAPRERVFEALTQDMGAWWPHRFSPEATVHLDPKLGGHFYEEHAGDGAIYATVTALQHPSRIQLTGPMGMAGPVMSVIDFTLTEQGDATVVALSHKAVGDILDETKRGYAEGWVEVFDVLDRHCAA